MQLDVLDATSRHDRAAAEEARQASLFGRGLTSRNAYDASRADASAAETARAAAQARLDAASAYQDLSVVRARFPGTVIHVWHAVGDAVRPGSDDPVLRVIDLSRVQVSVQLPIVQLARIVPGQQATVLAIAGAAPEPAQVVMKPGSTDAAAPTGEVRLGFLHPATLPLDTPVSVEIVLDQRTGALVVPADAVARDGGGPYVMVVSDDLRAHRRDVRVGLITRTQAQITQGLSAGERVVLTGLADVTDGAAVVPSR